MGNCACIATQSESSMIRNSTHPALKRPLDSYSTSGIEDLLTCPQNCLTYSKRSLTDFEIIKKIGEGSFGSVYLVNCALDKKQYAMKVILKANATEPRAKQMSMVEKTILAGNDHPFLLKLYYSFQDEYKLYLITDYVEGSDLSKNMKYRKKYSESDIIFYCSEILLALENLHFRGIIYRDLKPENILLTKEGHIKLADFGLSTFKKSPNEMKSSTVGTLNYIAPEIVLGQQGHNEQADIWSFGMTLYELFHGQPAFFSRDKMKQIDSCLKKEIQINPKISSEAQDLIRKLLKVDPNLRIGKTGIEEIKQHPFFQSVDWDKVERLETTGPKPICKNTLSKEIEHLNKPEPPNEHDNISPPQPSSYIPGFSYNFTMTQRFSERYSQEDMLQHSKRKFD